MNTDGDAAIHIAAREVSGWINMEKEREGEKQKKIEGVIDEQVISQTEREGAR